MFIKQEITERATTQNSVQCTNNTGHWTDDKQQPSYAKFTLHDFKTSGWTVRFTLHDLLSV